MADLIYNFQGSLGDTLRELAERGEVTEGDRLFFGQAVRTRSVDRTLSGIDINGQPFAPYSTKGPYYFYPNGKVNKAKLSNKQRRGQVKRFFARNEDAFNDLLDAYDEGRSRVQGPTGTFRRRQGKTYSGFGIKFPGGYAQLKESQGRGTPDLFGADKGPHMLQALLVKTDSEGVRVGLYGEEAARGKGHNEGAKNLPKRQWLGVDGTELDELAGLTLDRVTNRMNQGR